MPVIGFLSSSSRDVDDVRATPENAVCAYVKPEFQPDIEPTSPNDRV
jgi:hypothetical protein